MLRARQRHYGCRITEYTIAGLHAVALENAALRVGVLVDKGADIYEFLYKPRDVDPLWRSPNGIVNPARGTPSTASAGGAYMDSYEGGWQELFPTIGPPTRFHGAELGEHGEVALLPWEYRIERDEPEEVRVAFAVRTRRTPFALRRTLTLRGGSAALRVDEEVTNAGAEALQFMWGHHPVLGAPFLQPGCLLAVPGAAVNPVRLQEGHFYPTPTRTRWPVYHTDAGPEEDLRRLPEPSPAHVDELFLSDLPEGWYAVTNPHLGVGFALRWETGVFPYLWLWRTLGPAPGYPWYGRTYSLGLEPFSSVPPHLEDARAAGTLLQLGAGEKLATSLLAAAFAGTGPAVAVTEDGTVTVGTGDTGSESAAN
jgi:hypothetical protein